MLPDAANASIRKKTEKTKNERVWYGLGGLTGSGRVWAVWLGLARYGLSCLGLVGSGGPGMTK